MFNRNILNEFRKWANKSNRKPLVIRGARQVGKTTVVRMFSAEFDQYISLNLERDEERIIFEKNYPFSDLVISLFLYAGKKREGGRTLIFIDEIQNSPKAISLLRYFYEDTPDLYVISAVSLLETVLDRKISFPVGRVEYLAMHPCNFKEFLNANGQEQLSEMLDKSKGPDLAHDLLISWFRKYATTGGMPEVVAIYAIQSDLTALQPIYDTIVQSYIDDVEKYAQSSAQVQYLRHVIGNVFGEAGSTITFEKFANSAYRSREMKEAFLAVEKAMLLKLIYPFTSVQFPANPNLVRKPRLHVVDTGLINHVKGLMGELVLSERISDVYRGIIAEHIVGQELQASSYSVLYKTHFWTREKKESSAEVDYILPWQGKLIPIEVKSGTIGKLRSLHQFMDEAPHSIAVRVWQGVYSIDKARTITGKEFTLLNLPFYLVHRIENELNRVFT
jgi:predicted AAA+ superfamily ATPase